MRIRFVHGLIAVLGLLLAAGPLEAQTGSISGRVTAGEAGTPVGDAQVRVMQGMAEVGRGQTAADGSFRIENSKVTRNAGLVHVGSDYVGTSREIYIQTLNTLILEVYYRFLPATSAGSAHRRMGGLDHLDDLR